MLTVLLAMSIAVLRLCPASPLGRVLQHLLVDRPIAWIGQAGRRELLFLMILTALLFAGETLLALGSAELVISFAWGLSTYLDAAIATSVIALASQARHAARLWRSRKTRGPTRTRLGAVRRRRHRRRRTGRRKADDDRRRAVGLLPETKPMVA